MLVSKLRKPEQKRQLAVMGVGVTFITCERDLLRSPKGVVEPQGWSLYIEQTFQSVAIVIFWMGCNMAPKHCSP